MPTTRKRPRQTRLTFTPLPSSSPAAKDYPRQIQERAAQVGYDGARERLKRRKLQEADADDDALSNQLDGADELQLDEANGSMPSKRKRVGSSELPTPSNTMDRDDEDVSDDVPVKASQRRTSRQQQKRLDFSSRRDPGSFSSPVRLSSPSTKPSSSGMFGTQTRTRSVKKQPIVHLSSESESEPDEDQDLPTPKKRNLSRRSSQKPITVESSEEEGDGDDMPTTQGKLPRKRRRERSRDSFISSSPPRAVESDDDLEVISTSKRGRQMRDDSDDNEDEDEPITPSRRKLKRPTRKLTQQDEDDLAEDLDFLGPSSDVEALERAPRSTQSKAKSAREAALAKLKQKRSGTQEEPAEVDSEADGSEDEQLPQPASSRQYFEAGADDEDFIDEEMGDDEPLGMPEGVPIEFTHYARKKPKELFKHAVEWMVQKKINPAFDKYDELYKLTWRKLDDELRGLAGSKFTSSVWRQPFTLALRARPELAITDIDRHHGLPGHCDACNRSNHPATFDMQFQGKPYHPYTLESVAAIEEEDDDEEDDASSSESDWDEPGYNHEGNEIPPAATIYQVGKFCKANAHMSHNLQHWKWHLNEYVEAWLIRNSHLTTEKIVARDKKSMRKRKKEANRITDAMEAQGEVRTLWDMFRGNVDEARNAKQGHFMADSP